VDSTQTDYYATVSHVVDGCAADASNSGQVIQPGPMGGQFATFYQFSDASTQARASLGVLGAKAFAEASSTPASYTFTNSEGEAEIIPDSYKSTAGAGTSASWFDTLTNSNSDTIALRLFAVFHGSCAPQCFSGIPPFITAQTTATILNGCSAPPNNPFAACLSDFDIGPGGTTIWLEPGNTMLIGAQVGAQASALSGDSSGTYIPPNSSSADAFNTLGFYIDVIGDCTSLSCGPIPPGETYSTASGHIYSQDALNPPGTVVPEPSTLLVFCSMVAGLGVWNRKKVRLSRNRHCERNQVIIANAGNHGVGRIGDGDTRFRPTVRAF
jgi:hypothetical protein